MSVTLTDEQYGMIARALVFMAADRAYRPNGREHHISRADIITRARIACASINLAYRGDGSGNPAFPEEIGWQYRGAVPVKRDRRAERMRGRPAFVRASVAAAPSVAPDAPQQIPLLREHVEAG